MRVAAAASTRRSASVVLDVAGRRISLTSAEVQRLRDAMTDEAGRSSVARDLALLLGEALAGRTLALRRVEASTLARAADELGLGEVAGRIAA